MEGDVRERAVRADDRPQVAHGRGEARRHPRGGRVRDFRRALEEAARGGAQPPARGRRLRSDRVARAGRPARGDRHGQPREEPVRGRGRERDDQRLPHDRRRVRHGEGDGPRPLARAQALRLGDGEVRLREDPRALRAHGHDRAGREDPHARPLHRRGARVPHRRGEARAGEERGLRREAAQKVRRLSRPLGLHEHVGRQQGNLPHAHGDGRRRGARGARAGRTATRGGCTRWSSSRGPNARTCARTWASRRT